MPDEHAVKLTSFNDVGSNEKASLNLYGYFERMSKLLRTITPVRMYRDDLKDFVNWKDPFKTFKIAVIITIILVFSNYFIPIFCILLLLYRKPIISTLMHLRF